MGAFGGLAAAIGPSLGGILTDKLNWSWVFLLMFQLVYYLSSS